jgi:hydrogenase maturation protease
MGSVLRRLIALVVLVISAVGFVVFITAAVGVWQVKAETNRRTDEVAAKAHMALDAADRTVEFVDKVIVDADRDLKGSKGAPASPREPVNPFLQLTARQATEKLVGSVERVNTAVVTASEAAVVAKAALDLFGSDEQTKALRDWLGVQPEQLTQTQTSLKTATSELNKARTILGVPAHGGPTDEELVTVESALQQARAFTAQMTKVVATARAKVAETKQKIDLWAMRIAVLTTVVGAVGAAGQFFMARFCWRVLMGQPA